MRAPAKKDGPGRPAEHILRPLVAIGTKLSLTQLELNLNLACAAVNEVCEDPLTGAGQAGVEGPLCTSTLRKRVAAYMGGPKWRDLRREAHIAHYMSVLHRQCPHHVDSILNLVGHAVARVKGAPPAPPSLPPWPVVELPVEGFWDVDPINVDPINLDDPNDLIDLPLFAGLEELDSSPDGGGVDDVSLRWDDEIFRQLDIEDFFK